MCFRYENTSFYFQMRLKPSTTTYALRKHMSEHTRGFRNEGAKYL